MLRQALAPLRSLLWAAATATAVESGSSSSSSSGGGATSTMFLPEQILIWVVYTITLFFFAFKPHVLGFGRPLIALLGASVVVLIQDLTPAHRQNLEADVDSDILVYLFGLMIISHYMLLTGLVRIPNGMFRWTLKLYGPYALLWVLSFVTGTIAIFFTNDMTAFLLTPIIVRLTNDRKYPELRGSSFIFLMLLSTTANIASAMSPIGNPQNVLVASFSGISFGEFLKFLWLPTLLCWLGNTVIMTIWFSFTIKKQRKLLEKQRQMPEGASGSAAAAMAFVADEKVGLKADSFSKPSQYGSLNSGSRSDVNSTTASDPASEVATDSEADVASDVADDMDHLLGGGSSPSKAISDSSFSSYSVNGSSSDPSIRTSEAEEKPLAIAPPIAVKKMHPTVFSIVSLCSAFIFVAWIVLVTMCDVFLGWATLLAALTVVTVHALACYFCHVPVRPHDIIFKDPEIVDFGLIFMFHAQFVLIGSLLDTGWPQYVFDLLLNSIGDQIVELWWVMAFTFSVMIASNILTNVPVVLLLEPLISDLTDPVIGWLLIAFTTTVAGNLTLVGSACNLIVDARSRAIGGPELYFFQYLAFGAPTTILWIFLGTLLTVLLY